MVLGLFLVVSKFWENPGAPCTTSQSFSGCAAHLHRPVATLSDNGIPQNPMMHHHFPALVWDFGVSPHLPIPPCLIIILWLNRSHPTYLEAHSTFLGCLWLEPFFTHIQLGIFHTNHKISGIQYHMCRGKTSFMGGHSWALGIHPRFNMVEPCGTMWNHGKCDWGLQLHLCCDKDHLRQSGAWEGQNGSRAMDWSWKNNRKLQLLTQIALSCIVVFLYCKKILAD